MKGSEKLQVTLYTTHCPKCVILEKKLSQKKIKYNIVDDKQEIVKKGFLTAPLLEVNDEVMEFTKAVEWVNAQEG